MLIFQSHHHLVTAVDLVVKFSNRPDLRITNIDGNCEMTSLQSLIRSKLNEEKEEENSVPHPHEGGGVQGDQNFDMVTGRYKNEDVEDMYFEDSAALDLTTMQSNHQNLFRHAKLSTSIPPEAPLLAKDDTENSSLHSLSDRKTVEAQDGDGVYRSVLGDPLSSSSWNDAPPSDLRSRKLNFVFSKGATSGSNSGDSTFMMGSLGFRNKDHIGRPTESANGVNRKVLDVPFENFVKNAVEGLHTYRLYGNHRNIQSLRLRPSRENTSKDHVSHSHASVPSSQKRPNSSYAPLHDSWAVQKQMALEAVKVRRERIKTLEAEMRGNTSRQIDDILDEINASRSEINDISRKYLNYFYFF